jgi:8-oxo-dGTP pyrophosphatase MutT (NUDIX family)
MKPGPSRIETVDTIHYRHEPQPWSFAHAQSAEIDAHWSKLAGRNPHLFNGRVYMMHSYAIAEETGRLVLRGACMEVEYKAFLSWRDFGFPDGDVINCFAMGALLSADGAFMLGRMGDHTANAGQIYFPAGTPDPSDLVGSHVDLDGNILRELAEETGLQADEVAPDPSWTLVFEGQKLACMKILRSALSAAEIEARFWAFIAQEEQPELTGLHAVFSPADLDEARMPAFTLRYLRHVLEV